MVACSRIRSRVQFARLRSIVVEVAKLCPGACGAMEKPMTERIDRVETFIKRDLAAHLNAEGAGECAEHCAQHAHCDPKSRDGARPGTTPPRADGLGGCQSLVFTNDPAIVRQEKALVGYCGADEQDVLCIDERQVRVRSKAMFAEPDPCAHGVWRAGHDNQKRPGTSIGRGAPQ